MKSKYKVLIITVLLLIIVASIFVFYRIIAVTPVNKEDKALNEKAASLVKERGSVFDAASAHTKGDTNEASLEGTFNEFPSGIISLEHANNGEALMVVGESIIEPNLIRLRFQAYDYDQTSEKIETSDADVIDDRLIMRGDGDIEKREIDLSSTSQGTIEYCSYQNGGNHYLVKRQKGLHRGSPFSIFTVYRVGDGKIIEQFYLNTSITTFLNLEEANAKLTGVGLKLKEGQKLDDIYSKKFKTIVKITYTGANYKLESKKAPDKN